MAKMYPTESLEPIASGAEARLFEAFKSELPNSYVVLHSVKWLSRKNGRDADGEADFLILHPDYGALVLEVKGGEISRDPLTGQWYSRARNNHIHPIKDPFGQAQRAMYSLRDKFQESRPDLRLADGVKRAVAFPDVKIVNQPLGPDAPRWLILDSFDVRTLESSLLRAWRPSPDAAIGDRGVAAIVNLLSPAIELKKPGLATAIESEQEEFIRLTRDQMRVLDVFSAHRRAAVRGVAGSGKSILAIEAARRLAAQGFRVLYTCFNQALADWARESLRQALNGDLSNVYVDNYHDLAEDFARRAGIRLPAATEVQGIARAYYDEMLPQFLMNATAILPDRFDAIIIDEGQDFADVWWLTLESLLGDPAEGIFYLFYDENQVLFSDRGGGSYPIVQPHLQLTYNWRSTRSIHDLAVQYCRTSGAQDCLGPAGRPPDYVTVKSGGELDALRKVVHKLVHDEGVALDQIVVLTPRAQHRSALTDGARIGNVTLSWEAPGANTLHATSIAKYKGLESPVVVLAELEHAYWATRNALIHVALTRAKNHLVILGDLPDPD